MAFLKIESVTTLLLRKKLPARYLQNYPITPEEEAVLGSKITSINETYKKLFSPTITVAPDELVENLFAVASELMKRNFNLTLKCAQDEAKKLAPEIQEIYLALLKELNSLSESLAFLYASRGIAAYDDSQRTSLTTLSEQSLSRERGFSQLLPLQAGFFNRSPGSQSPDYLFPAAIERSDEGVSEPNEYEVRRTPVAR